VVGILDYPCLLSNALLPATISLTRGTLESRFSARNLMYPRIFDVPFLNTFGVCLSIGLVLCFVVARYYARVRGANPAFADFGEGNAYVAIGVGILVSLVGQAFFNYLENPSGGFKITTAATYISGLIGGIVAFVIGYLAYGRKKFGPRFIEILPIAPVCITIAHAFGRLGCFFGGCCYGKPTDSFLGVRFPNLLHKVFPTQLFESLFLFLLFGVLFYLTFKKRSYQTFAIYLFSYGVFRFCIEFIRGDHRGAFVGSLSPSQTLAIVMVVGSVGLWFLTERLVRSYRANEGLTHKLDL
jgi:phosphatidylglycerol---prolipoprotein diacylglyceryl transferase